MVTYGHPSGSATSGHSTSDLRTRVFTATMARTTTHHGTFWSDPIQTIYSVLQKAPPVMATTATSRGGIYIPPAKRRRFLEEENQKLQHDNAPPQAEPTLLSSGGNTNKNETAATATAPIPEKNDKGEQQDLQQQRATWEAQKRIIHGTINRLNCSTIKPLVVQLLQKVNLLRMKGVLARSILQATLSSASTGMASSVTTTTKTTSSSQQSSSSAAHPNQSYAAVYAALVSVLHSKLPQIGELVVARTIVHFRRSYQRREKATCMALVIFLGHLFHQGVVHELILLQLLTVLLDGGGGGGGNSNAGPTEDSIQVAIQLLQITGYQLLQVTPAGVRAVTETLRAILHDGTAISKRVAYQIEAVLELRKQGFEVNNNGACCYPPIADELDLVEADDQITLEMSLDDDDLDPQEELNVFSFDPQYAEKEQMWNQIKAELLGEGADDEDDDSDDDEDGEGSTDDEQDEEVAAPVVEERALSVTNTGDATKKSALVVHQDMSEADLVHLRRTIYLTIMSSATFEECVHKLASIDIPPDAEHELVNMLLECCSQERTFLLYYGLVAARFCVLHQRWKQAFETAFVQQYNTIHRLETNKLRNVAKLFAHLLYTDAIPWSVLSVIHLNETETTSSSRIFIKILMQEIAQSIGMAKLKERLQPQSSEQPGADLANIGDAWNAGLFPRDNVRNTRYAINFFTSIGLGPLTDELREFLKNAPKLIMEQVKQEALAKSKANSDTDDSSSLSSSSSSSSSSTFSSSSSSSLSRSSSDSYSSDRRRRRNRRRGDDDSRSTSTSSRSYSSRSYSSRSTSPSRSRSRRLRDGKRDRSLSYSSSDSQSSDDGRRSARSNDRKRSYSREASRSESPDHDDGHSKRSYHNKGPSRQRPSVESNRSPYNRRERSSRDERSKISRHRQHEGSPSTDGETRSKSDKDRLEQAESPLPNNRRRRSLSKGTA